MSQSTQKTAKVSIIIIVIAILAVAFFFLIQMKKESQPSTTMVEDVQVDGVGSPSDGQPFSGMGTLMSLQALQKDLECQISYKKEGQADVEGTYFVSGGKMRGDFVVPAPEFGGTIVSSLIIDSATMYVWSKIGEDTFGFKSNRVEESEAQVDGNEPVPLDADVKYTCSEWGAVDGSVFVPPETVEFKDLGAVIEAGMEYGTLPN